MINPEPTILNIVVHATNGEKFTAVALEDRSFGPTSLTAGTIQSFVNKENNKKFFIQGDKIAFIEVIF